MPQLSSIAAYIWYYAYGSLLAPSRLDVYEDLIGAGLKAGYTSLTVEDFARRIRAGQALPRLTLVLCNDIDTDPSTARRMFDINRRFGIQSSYFFRLSTLDFELMSEMAAFGCEASYHFEEIATYAKRRGTASAKEVLGSLREIQERFRENLTWLRARTGLKMQVVASHGDFANRILGLANQELLDASLRRDLDIFAEAYDADLAMPLTAGISDHMPPVYWRGGDPLLAIRDRSPVIYLLVHPRHWRAKARVNLLDAGRRIAEGTSFAMRRKMAPYRHRRSKPPLRAKAKPVRSRTSHDIR